MTRVITIHCDGCDDEIEALEPQTTNLDKNDFIQRYCEKCQDHIDQHFGPNKAIRGLMVGFAVVLMGIFFLSR